MRAVLLFTLAAALCIAGAWWVAGLPGTVFATISGTTIETTSWTDGELPPAPTLVVAALGAPAPIAPHLAPAPAVAQDLESTSLLWVGVVGIGLLLGAALVVVRTLRQ